MFCRQFKTLCRKNWILWKRNLGASLCELLFPIFLIALILVIRLAISKSDRESAHLLARWQVFRKFDSVTDTDASGGTRYFMELSSLYDEVFMQCYETNENVFKTRTLVRIPPASSSNSVTNYIKHQIEY